MSIRRMVIEHGWIVDLVVDDDFHLSVYVINQDGSPVMDTGEEIGRENEWGARLTTGMIEEEYKSRMKEQE